eukprot:12302057-Karenia_brevis.AAC.1
MSANVTSMNTQISYVDSVSAEVLALQEVRLSETGQRDMSAELYGKGWTCLWGKPQEPQVRADTSFIPSPWNATHG